VHGGLTVLAIGTLLIFFRIVSKLSDFMTLLGHVFLRNWFNFYADVLWNEFLAIFYYVNRRLYRSIAAVSAADCYMRDVQMVPVGG